MRRGTYVGLTVALALAGVTNRGEAELIPAISALELYDPQPEPGGSVPIAAGSDATVGWSFSVTTPIEVRELGFYDFQEDGLAQPHMVGIWDEGGVLLREVEVVAQEIAPLAGSYRYAGIEPLELAVGRTYVIGATVPLGSFVGPAAEDPNASIVIDRYPYFDVAAGSAAIHPAILLDANALIYPGVLGPGGTPGPGQLTLPQVTLSDGYFLAPNFGFTVVPEPTSALVLTVGFLSFLVRNKRV